MKADEAHPPSSVLTVTLLLNVMIAVVLSAFEAGLLALLLMDLDSSRDVETEFIASALFLAVLFAPGFALFSAFLSSFSWVWHASSEAPRPVWADALFGVAAGAALGMGYLAQDVMGCRSGRDRRSAWSSWQYELSGHSHDTGRPSADSRSASSRT